MGKAGTSDERGPIVSDAAEAGSSRTPVHSDHALNIETVTEGGNVSNAHLALVKYESQRNYITDVPRASSYKSPEVEHSSSTATNPTADRLEHYGIKKDDSSATPAPQISTYKSPTIEDASSTSEESTPDWNSEASLNILRGKYPQAELKPEDSVSQSHRVKKVSWARKPETKSKDDQWQHDPQLYQWPPPGPPDELHAGGPEELKPTVPFPEFWLRPPIRPSLPRRTRLARNVPIPTQELASLVSPRDISWQAKCPVLMDPPEAVSDKNKHHHTGYVLAPSPSCDIQHDNPFVRGVVNMPRSGIQSDSRPHRPEALGIPPAPVSNYPRVPDISYPYRGGPVNTIRSQKGNSASTPFIVPVALKQSVARVNAKDDPLSSLWKEAKTTLKNGATTELTRILSAEHYRDGFGETLTSITRLGPPTSLAQQHGYDDRYSPITWL